MIVSHDLAISRSRSLGTTQLLFSSRAPAEDDVKEGRYAQTRDDWTRSRHPGDADPEADSFSMNSTRFYRFLKDLRVIGDCVVEHGGGDGSESN